MITEMNDVLSVAPFTQEDREIFRSMTSREVYTYWTADQRDAAYMFASVDEKHEEKRVRTKPA